MSVLPKIMYKMQMVPISIPQNFLNKLHTLFLMFIWRGKKTRIKYTQLVNDKRKGGWGSPDIKKYYVAIVISRIIDWVKTNIEKQCAKIEGIMSGVDWGKNVWIPPQCRKLSTKTLDITKHVLNMWDKIHDREKWGYNSPLIPLKDTDYFLPGREDLFGRWILKDEAQLKDIMSQGKLCTYQELKAKDKWFIMDFFKYRQLKHFVDTLPQPIRLVEDLRPLEKAL